MCTSPEWRRVEISTRFLFFETGAAMVPERLMFLYGMAQLGIRFLQRFSFLLGQSWIFKRGENVIDLRFHLLEFCTEHVDLRFRRSGSE